MNGLCRSRRLGSGWQHASVSGPQRVNSPGLQQAFTHPYTCVLLISFAPLFKRPRMRIKNLQSARPYTHGPGPSDVHPRVLAALSRPTIGHLDPKFVEMMDEVKVMLQYAFQTKNELTMPVSAPGLGGHGDLLRESDGAGR